MCTIAEARSGGDVYDTTATVRAEHRVRSVAETLARETHQPVELVAQVYASERQALESHASITTYIDVLAMRRVKLILKACEEQ
jgi:hypothetical protein